MFLLPPPPPPLLEFQHINFYFYFFQSVVLIVSVCVSQKMNSIILDVQGFSIEDNKFLPKELATYNGDEVCHYIFKPPFPFDMLSPHLQRNAVYLTSNHHTLNWNAGFTPLHQFQKIMDDLSKKTDLIYVKGREKATYIQKFTTKKVIELDEQPKITKQKAKCIYHNDPNNCICALTNVFNLYEYFF